MTFQDGLSLIKLHERLITSSFGITWQTKPIIYPLTQWLTTVMALKPCDSLNTWPTWGYVTVWKIYISPFIILMAIKIYKVLTSGRSFSPQNLKTWLLAWFKAINILNYFLSSLYFLYCNLFETRFYFKWPMWGTRPFNSLWVSAKKILIQVDICDTADDLFYILKETEDTDVWASSVKTRIIFYFKVSHVTIGQSYLSFVGWKKAIASIERHDLVVALLGSIGTYFLLRFDYPKKPQS